MKDLTTQSPLMAPIEYDGQTYFTSQSFHREYLQNGTGKKYKQHKNFLHLLRSIETYSVYLAHGDIVENDYHGLDTGLASNSSQWKLLFRASGYQPITLLNATAQLALSHHMDDEGNKKLSVATNVAMAQHATAGVIAPSPGTMALALAQAVCAVEVRVDALEASVAALQERRPPEDRMTVFAFLKNYKKPFLPRAIMDNFKYHCRAHGDAILFRPDGFDMAFPYYTLDTLVAAYEHATKQLSFLTPRKRTV